MDYSKAFQLEHERKTSFFACRRQFLELDHLYRRNRVAFKKGKVEKSLPPERLPPETIFERIAHLPSVVHNGQVVTIPGYGRTHNWTKRSIF